MVKSIPKESLQTLSDSEIDELSGIENVERR